jgi:hypothetical protein
MTNTKVIEGLAAIVALARDVRKAQKQYFKTRDKGDLAASKKLEAALDKVLAFVSTDQESLL